MAGNAAVCNDTSEAVELFKAQGLYLKPIAKLNVSVQLPQLKQPGKTISNWEVMEKVKHMVKPHSFLAIKVIKSTLEFIRLEGEADNKALIKALIQRLEGKTIKLSGFPDTLKIKAAEAKISFPLRHTWDSYFRDAKNMNEMKPGERPDTLHLKDLPTKWFSNRRSRDTDEPSEQVLRRIFEGFGEVRCVDIPMLDPYRKEMISGKKSIQTFTFGQQGLTFEAFVQYKEYIGFVKAMDGLRGMKLLYMPEEEEGKAYAATIKVDFDKSKHLSDRAIKKRRIEREKLMELERQREEKVRKEREEEARKQEEERRKKEEEEQERERKRLEKIQKREERRKEREMKRREKREERKKREEERRYQLKIQMEERKFLIAQRKLESIRLLTELFNRVKNIKVQDDLELREKELELEKERQIELELQRKEEEKWKKKEARQKRKAELQKQEHELRHKLLKNFQLREEQKEEEMREKLREKLAGTTKVKSAVIMKKKLKEVFDDRDQSMDLYGYGTMNNWDQSVMDENYTQWAMAFYSYWYQRYAAFGFYKPKAMGFYKPKGFNAFKTGNKGYYKFSPQKYYKQGRKGFYKPGMKGYYNTGPKGFFKHCQSQGFQKYRDKGFYKGSTKSYYAHDSRDDYSDSQDYDYKSRDTRYKQNDYTDDSDYHDENSRRWKRKTEDSEQESDSDELKAKKSKRRKKVSKRTVKKSRKGNFESSESGEIESVKSDVEHRKKKKVARKRKSKDLKSGCEKQDFDEDGIKPVKSESGEKDTKVSKSKRRRTKDCESMGLFENSDKEHSTTDCMEKDTKNNAKNQEVKKFDLGKSKTELSKSDLSQLKAKKTSKRHKIKKSGQNATKKRLKHQAADHVSNKDNDDLSKEISDCVFFKDDNTVSSRDDDISGQHNKDRISEQDDNDTEVEIS